MQVLPLVIAEEVVRKTLSGREVTYLVKRDQTNSVYNLTEIEGQVFSDLEDVKKLLLKNTQQAVNKICQSAQNKAASLQVAPQPTVTRQAAVPTDDELKSFILDDGTKVRINARDM
tara:strand:+ start:148 stop:495 length:348 start_codon:yes stop_codon:yes gene_type:complete